MNITRDVAVGGGNPPLLQICRFFIVTSLFVTQLMYYYLQTRRKCQLFSSYLN
jgi:hypothetical protein